MHDLMYTTEGTPMTIATFKPDLMGIAAMTSSCPRNATGKVLKRELRKQFLSADAPEIS